MNFIKRAYQNYKRKREIKRQVFQAWGNFAAQRNLMVRKEDDHIWDEIKKISDIK